MRDRKGARVLLLDARHRVLLFHGRDPANPGDQYWISVGGGLDPGEDSRAAAVRELFEETGLRADPAQLSGPLWHEVVEFPFNGEWYRQEQDWFLLRVESWTVDTSGFQPDERASVDRWHWWSADELRASAEQYYPVRLPDVLDRIGAEIGDDPAP